MLDITKIKWQQKINNIPLVVSDWIFDKKSLTQKLKDKYDNFKVELLQEKLITPNKNEEYIVGKNNIFVREVFLCGNDKHLVFARSLIPTNAYNFLNLKEKPLGEILLQNKAIRKNIEVAKNDNIWGRRSIFIVDKHAILVAEFFMPILYA